MIISRLMNRVPRLNFAAVDAALTQIGVYRRLCGGVYVKMQGRWYGATTIIVLDDGSRVLRRDDCGGGFFHETLNAIQQLEDHS
jgi:hypothetical protein